MNINELIDKAHANAVAKGFWEGERNQGELLMLIISECGEALEAHRKGRRAQMNGLNPAAPITDWAIKRPEEEAYVLMWKEAFEACIKDSMEDELSDIVIRIADLMGHLDHTFKNYDLSKKSDKDNVGEALLSTCSFICSGNSGGYNLSGLDAALLSVFWLANKHDIDLWRFIQLKMAYNTTRERLHGKQY